MHIYTEWKSKTLTSYDSNMKNSTPDYLYKLCSSCVFPDGRRGELCSSMGTQVYTPWFVVRASTRSWGLSATLTPNGFHCYMSQSTGSPHHTTFYAI